MTTREEYEQQTQQQKWDAFEPNKLYFYLEMVTDKMVDELGSDEPVKDRVKTVADWIIPPKYRTKDSKLGELGSLTPEDNPRFVSLPTWVKDHADPLGQRGYYLFRYEPEDTALRPDLLATKKAMCDSALDGLRHGLYLPFSFLLVI